VPKYLYKCTNCPEVREEFHSIKITLIDCGGCITSGVSGSLQRVPSQILTITSKSGDGKLVRDYIKDTKEDVKQYKKELASKGVPGVK
jgi:predicted nucleic acid-binding Zn ribbon protein